MTKPKQYRIVEYQDGHCTVQEKTWFFWSTLQVWEWFDGEDVTFPNYEAAATWIDQRLAETTIKKIKEHP